MSCEAHVSRPWKQETRAWLDQFRRRRLRFCRGFRRQCLRNWSTQIKEPHLLKVALGKTSAAALGKIRGQLFEEFGSICCTDLSSLFKFDNVMSDQPVRSGHDRVHASCRSAPRLVNEAHNAIEHCAVIARANSQNTRSRFHNKMATLHRSQSRFPRVHRPL